MPPAILHWLMNETPESYGIRFHQKLEDRHFTLPVFFRTDEVIPGRISEIQCPGSAWGELQLSYEHTARLGYRVEGASPASQFATQLTHYLKEPPVVHYLLDNSSAPVGMRYFIAKTRPAVRYYSIDRDIRSEDCNFVRGHAFISIVTQINFPYWMAKTGQGVICDPPPYVLFDQKASSALPYWPATREYFSDASRGIFPFTAPLLPTGIYMPDGGQVSIEGFSKLPKS